MTEFIYEFFLNKKRTFLISEIYLSFNFTDHTGSYLMSFLERLFIESVNLLKILILNHKKKLF